MPVLSGMALRKATLVHVGIKLELLFSCIDNSALPNTMSFNERYSAFVLLPSAMQISHGFPAQEVALVGMVGDTPYRQLFPLSYFDVLQGDLIHLLAAKGIIRSLEAQVLCTFILMFAG